MLFSTKDKFRATAVPCGIVEQDNALLQFPQ